MPPADAQSHDHGRSVPVPVEARWGHPDYVWCEQYPPNVPPSLDYTAVRAEQLLIDAAEQYPDRVAIRYFNTNWTYSELLSRVQQVAGNLQRQGIGVGDRVLLILPNCPEFVTAWFALHWLGAEVVPANPLLAGKDLVHLVESTQACAVIGLDARFGPVASLLGQVDMPLLIVASLSGHLPFYMRIPYRLKIRWRKKLPADIRTSVHTFDELYRTGESPLATPRLTDVNLPAVLQPTGGTTGTPKIAVLTHRNLHANVTQLHAWCGFDPGQEVVLAVLPFFHVFGATVALLSAIGGGATLLLQAKFSAKRVWKVMERWQPGVAPMVPFMFAALCTEMKKRGKNITGLRCCFSGASPLSPELKEEFQTRTGATVYEGYGLSEASPVTHVNPPGAAAQAGSIGLPLPDTSARIVDAETGEIELPPGEVGELVIRGPQVMAGYLRNHAESAQVIRDNWLYTGDLARMDEKGFFTLVDRKKDMIISGGLNVYPAEVEAVLSAHPDVGECAIVGLPDALYGEAVTAYVVPSVGAEICVVKLKEHCSFQLASYKIPKTIEVRKELPKNFLGKVRRVELRNRAA